ncbi:MAG TPA: nucleoside-diphosphate sugar epimerase/dehydratase [Acidimicrobiales bacterium]|nr:nucleoside-diphosphate sugar epimerase/dehydratase [Acidimicrobiales bacterium]
MTSQADLESVLRRYRSVIEPVTDSVVWATALLAMTALRFDLKPSRVFTFGVLEAIEVVIAAQIGIGFAVSLYRIKWKNASFEEFVALATTIANCTAILVLANVVFLSHAVPVSSIVAAGAFTFVGTGGLRAGWRIRHELLTESKTAARRAIIFGAGNGGEQVIDVLRSSHNPPFAPVALLDDSPAKRQVQIRHLRVSGGREEISEVAKRLHADTLIIAIARANSSLIRELSQRASAAGLDVRVLPPVNELLPNPAVSVSDIRAVSLIDLLGRHEIQTDVDSIASYLTGHRVLVTGAGGSIGSELCRQIHRYAPSSLVMLDRDESGLHALQLSIEGQALLNDRRLVVNDIRDLRGLHAIFEEHRPEVVFHAAALKHLPLLEMWPAEAIKTNVFGTLNVLAACQSHQVLRFVNISTDKAADPTSVLGFTKRISERLTATVAAQHDKAYLSVRFGNVLGSRGSVLATFQAQIASGGPLTVTHPDATRFFMTVQEAVQLVVQAGAIGTNGEVLVLDMGSPARIAEVAARLAERSDRRIRVTFTGLRPGEKLHEARLAHGEPDVRPIHNLISHVVAPPIDPNLFQAVDLHADATTLREMLHWLSIVGTPISDLHRPVSQSVAT